MNILKNKIFSAIKKLDTWIENNGWSGYDPYDIKAIKFVRWITKLGNKNYFVAIVREVIFEIFYTFPINSRKIFHIQPQFNAKAMALFSKSYLDLFISTKNENYLKKSRYCREWLENNRSQTNTGAGWGYPFDWQTRVLIPKFTPNGIVTTIVGDAFWSWHKYTHEQKYLDICVEICHFLISLPIDNIAKDQICFAYTPLSKNHIHNLNLFVAEFLIKIGKETGYNEWIKLAMKAINYTISYQEQNGSFDYNGPPDKLRKFYDNYHTGFVLRMLHSIWKMTDSKEIYKSLERCYYHYLNNFFEDSKIPKLLPNRKYRIDIHSCAESIYCLSQLAESFPEGKKIACKIADWTIDNLQDKTGYFYYGMLRSRFTRMPFLSKIAYLRWGQAWMLKGLSNLFINKIRIES